MRAYLRPKWRSLSLLSFKFFSQRARVSMLIAINSLSARIKPWWRCENLESTSWILVWIRRRLFAGLEFMFTYFYVQFRCFKCDHNTLSLHRRKVWGDYVVYQSLATNSTWLVPHVKNYRKWKWRIVYEYCCPLLLCFIKKSNRLWTVSN